ncbi:hypothetical protein E2C01_050605 [Portunus trituberculatus]|uniref:Uncharacterized protein n=1 Tax=Portunus trituberculatus TaxID=210409 RepID=A0A5B7G8R5_PORTR|nr:hypothetical protein [Portunus trituberculatus]
MAGYNGPTAVQNAPFRSPQHEGKDNKQGGKKTSPSAISPEEQEDTDSKRKFMCMVIKGKGLRWAALSWRGGLEDDIEHLKGMIYS